jgi:hypothetical protein
MKKSKKRIQLNIETVRSLQPVGEPTLKQVGGAGGYPGASGNGSCTLR